MRSDNTKGYQERMKSPDQDDRKLEAVKGNAETNLHSDMQVKSRSQEPIHRVYLL